jgi:hypothetical protein
MTNYIKYGLFTSLALILYFLSMKLFGLETNFYLRFLNFLIIIIGVYALIKQELKKPEATYFSTLINGISMTVVTVLTFLVFLAVYIKFIDPSFIEVMEASNIWGNQLSVAQASVAIFIEGMASGLVITFAWLQYFKNSFTKVETNGAS